MSDSLLKREFDKRTVQRIRNIINKNAAGSTGIQVGYQRPSETHEDGVPFEENGKSWVYINGLKQNITKLDSLKKLSIIPLSCPACKEQIKTQYDKKMYLLHKMCMNCVVKFETKLKIEGKYKDYSDALVHGNIDGFLKEYEDFIKDINKNASSMNGFVTEDGVVEKWIGNSQQVVTKMQDHLNDIKKTR